MLTGLKEMAMGVIVKGARKLNQNYENFVVSRHCGWTGCPVKLHGKACSFKEMGKAAGLNIPQTVDYVSNPDKQTTNLISIGHCLPKIRQYRGWENAHLDKNSGIKFK